MVLPMVNVIGGYVCWVERATGTTANNQKFLEVRHCVFNHYLETNGTDIFLCVWDIIVINIKNAFLKTERGSGPPLAALVSHMVIDLSPNCTTFYTAH